MINDVEIEFHEDDLFFELDDDEYAVEEQEDDFVFEFVDTNTERTA